MYELRFNQGCLVDSERVMKSLVISIEIYLRIKVLPRMLSG
jgi:hypothetical protein